MSDEFYQIQVITAKATSLAKSGEHEIHIRVRTIEDRRVDMVLSRPQLEALAQQIAKFLRHK